MQYYSEGSITKTATFKVTVNAVTTTQTTTEATTSSTTTTTTTTTTEPLKVDATALTMRNGEQYSIKANQGNLTFKSSDTNVAVVSKNGIITAVGEGEAIITVTNSDYNDVQISIVVKPAQDVEGDCNGDGQFDIADAVLLQKWLLAVPDTHFANWKAADMCEDNRLDVFDLCIMKRKLINMEGDGR